MYKVIIENKVIKQILKLNNPIRDEIIAAIEKLSAEPRGNNVKKLYGNIGYRLRTNVFRVLFDISDKDKLVRVYKIGHRKDVYNKGLN